MQATKNTPNARNQAHRKLYALPLISNNFQPMAALRIVASSTRDDCSTSDKLPKQIDDLIEGGSPTCFRRLKMSCDIIAR
ncbi:hypothetical protein RGU70_03375 [Herbaspirillum sp. RTI4]|uniref:hypothetical protein n=1 Tax=Herbaspirillum sp. RTI4 TaxID=3048640 RepID=UPI002AB3C203|nr:hypothetical protein [Herbaspirillum sp. RTI4]MDY7577368.1 hypothetical protein [Herbaspirillum sp. RTI4]MEA9982404.1 hypothetical protein [Herbaspirillum sp. RTI4]